MKIVKGSIVASVLVIGFAAAVHAQTAATPDNAGAGGMNGAQSGQTHDAGAVAGTNPGAATGMSPTPGVGTAGGVGAGPVLNNMRANGTSLDMSPNPRMPNLAGRPLQPR